MEYEWTSVDEGGEGIFFFHFGASLQTGLGTRCLGARRGRSGRVGRASGCGARGIRV
ncbi:hypothetical protein ES319_A04G024000v1 [Gossypium barbadense]|uniref:Uncharacterized protein n=2 Tax=Gossypium TaxID=3633 RepID=A0A5J5W347_GOSBA|nr:hypothetical protein ES319_A04G024000v1 [Gossypium barbadense]TYH21251.1 hypothetical protein ES288_A04G028500v1 [Gossypium darwinii]